MTASFRACHEALYAAVHGAALAVGGVYDQAPQTVTFPWIEIGDRQALPDDTGGGDGAGDDGLSDFFDMHIWSRHGGKKEVEQILDGLHSLLHGVSLSVTGRGSALCWLRTTRILKDDDGLTFHGIASLEIVHRN